MTAYAIYIITNKINAKQYVGITKRLSRRWTEHKMMKGDSVALYSAFKKYGVENFVFTHIADAFDKDAACTIERLLIAEKNTITPNGYNMTSGGDGGFVMSDETRAKMSAAKKGKPAYNKGKPSNPESVAKMSATKKGKPWTPEQREKIMAGRLASTKTPSIKGGSFGMLGKNHSEATKEKMRLAQRARFDAAQAIKKASEVTL
jgi:group I intron endonuclease